MGERGRRWTRIFKLDARTEVNEELTFHIEEREREYIARGLDPQAARAAAQERLGDLGAVRAECTDLLTAERRTEARREWMKMSWLDFRLGFRMLLKYPGLTLIGGFAMAFAIWIGAGTFEFMTQLLRPKLPLPDGDRIVGIRLWHTASSSVEEQGLYEFGQWRGELQSIKDLGVFREQQRNLFTTNGGGEPVEVAEISASAFRVAQVAPLLGRPLQDQDEQAGAPNVVVIGYEIWQKRFGGVGDVVGQTVLLGNEQYSVVGVMPEGFAFPIDDLMWIPFRLDVLKYGRRAGPEVFMFGRLAPGASRKDAQSELTSLGMRNAADFPETHEHIRPQVVSYARLLVNIPLWMILGFGSINLAFVMLLVLICGNVALLMFARAATRENEIVVRSALGASRGRIIAQLFAEALVLGLVAAAVGLAAARFGLRWGMTVVEGEMLGGERLPFWFVPRLSPTTVLYGGALTVLAAVISGVLPALKVTRGLQSRLRESTAGAGGLNFGGVWTAVIVAQIAATIAFPAVAWFVRRDAQQIKSLDVGIAEEEYLSAQVELDRAAVGTADFSRDRFLERFRATQRELERRLRAEPAVAGVTFGDRIPRMYHLRRLVELDEGGVAPLNSQWPGHQVGSASVAQSYFDVFGVPVHAGRAFHSADFASNAGVVIVNDAFVKRVLGGRNPIGRRMRYLPYEPDSDEPTPDAKPGPWLEIIGVVRNMGTAMPHDPKEAGVYHPAAATLYPLQMAIHVKGDPSSFAPRLRQIAHEVDPALQLDRVVPISQIPEFELQFLNFWFQLALIVSGTALVLSLAGIYAVMSFAVSRRTREIGIRVALGASQRRIVSAIFARPLLQVTLGIIAGTGVVAFLSFGITGLPSPTQALLIATYSAVMFAVCMLACVVPTRRALGVQPIDALKADG